jgi:hypothetical protein
MTRWIACYHTWNGRRFILRYTPARLAETDRDRMLVTDIVVGTSDDAWRKTHTVAEFERMRADECRCGC